MAAAIAWGVGVGVEVAAGALAVGETISVTFVGVASAPHPTSRSVISPMPIPKYRIDFLNRLAMVPPLRFN
jgi:hypothetical protein